MDISSLNSSNILEQYTATQNANQSTELDKALNTDVKTSSSEEQMKACKQFEQYFVEQIVKEMKKTVPKDSIIGDNEYVNMFEDNMVQSVASKIVDSGQLTFAQQLYKSMQVQHDSNTNTQE